MEKIYYNIIIFIILTAAMITFITPIKFDDIIGLLGTLIAIILLLRESINDFLKWFLYDKSEKTEWFEKKGE